MGFIRIQTKTKKGKTYKYYYYSERRRSGVKDGGDGKVRSIDKLIGDHSVNGKYLEFWLWDGLGVVDYLEAMVSYVMKRSEWMLPGIKWEIDWRRKKGKVIAGKLKFRGTPNIDPESPMNVDARSKDSREWRLWFQSCIDVIFEKENFVIQSIDWIAYCLANYENEKESLAQAESDYQQWKKDPYREWEDGDTIWHYHESYGDNTLERMEICRHNIDYWMEAYQAKTDDLMEICPPSERERFKAAVIRQTEGLASSPNFIERYEAKQ